MKTREQLIADIRQFDIPGLALEFWFDFLYERVVAKQLTEQQLIDMFDPTKTKGGPGSGNHGHSGRPGQHGGSTGGSGASGGGVTISDEDRETFAMLTENVTLNERQRAVAEQIGEEETKAIMLYSSEEGLEDADISYKQINKPLREHQEIDEVQQLTMAHIDSGLQKLPEYDGKVYRGVTAPGEFEDANDFISKKYPVGQVVRDEAYMSTSYDELTPFGFATDPLYGEEKRAVLFEIDSKTGRDISQISGRLAEKEVLFMRNTRFNVDSVYVHPDENVPVVRLVEQTANSLTSAEAHMLALQLTDIAHMRHFKT